MTAVSIDQHSPDQAVWERLARIQVARRRTLWVFGVLTLVGTLFYQSTWSITGSYHHNIEIAGLVLIFVAILGRAWCALYLGGNKNRKLISSGPYSLSRNPLYVFSLIGVFGMSAQTGSVSLGLVVCALSYAVFKLVVGEEEALLRKAFGTDFSDYCRRTPRFVPRFANWRNETTLTISMRAVQKTVIEALPFLLALPIFEFVEHLQASGVLPVLLHLP